MLVMDIGIMGVAVNKRPVNVRVRVRLTAIPRKLMLVLVMLVVPV